jgi:hypothetical protein
MSKNKLITAIILLTLIVSVTALPIANAHSPPWTVATHAYLAVSPDPVGVGQQVTIVAWVNIVFPGAVATNDVRFRDFKIDVTKPDGTKEVLKLDTTDSTSTSYTLYTPNQVGEYSFVFSHPDTVFTWNYSTTMSPFVNDIFKGGSSKTVKLTVQEEQLPNPKTSYPMPSEYWTRPIEGQNTDWWAISSNWLGGVAPNIIGRVQPNGIAPNSAHVMWTKPIDDGGVVGGTNVGIDGNTFYPGLSYNFRFRNPIIMFGRLFYELPFGNAASGAGYVAIDLRTGEELWWLNTTREGIGGADTLFGYYYDYEHMNQHGVLPQGWIFTSNFAKAINPRYGTVATLNLTNVPSGYAIRASTGEHLRYGLDAAKGLLSQWNSSNVFEVQTSGNIPANAPLNPAPSGTNTYWNGSLWVSNAIRQQQGYASVTKSSFDWNITLSRTLPSGMTIRAAKLNDLALVSDIASGLGSGFSTYSTIDPYKVAAISLNPSSRGTILWMKDYSAPMENVTRTLSDAKVDWENRVFIATDKESLTFVGFSLDTGNQLWTTERQDASDFEYFSTGGSVYNGKLYYAGYGGVLYCYDTKTGKTDWTYGNGGEGNSTFSGLYTPWGNYPVQIHAIADEKVYLFTTEHSPNTPLYKDSLVRCIDATNGNEIFTLMGYSGTHTQPPPVAVADGFLVYQNYYDYQIYCVGKGPSSTTITASPKVTELGNSMLIEGTVIDIAAGTKQKEQAARFPNGVPAVSDESMGKWMEYVYMQKPRPTDTVGVPVTISVVDANGNYRDIGSTTSDADGFYSLNWKPDIEGKYTVYASFGGSESYWPSHAITSFAVDPAAATPVPTPAPLQSMADTYFLPAIAGLFVLIIIVLVLVVLLMLKKRP